MFCNNCGNKVDLNQKFCTECGSSTSEIKKEVVKNIEKEAGAVKKSWTLGRVIKYVLVIGVVAILVLLKVIFGAINLAENDSVQSNDQGLSSFQSGDTENAIRQLSDASESAILPSNKMNTLKNLGYVYSSEGNTTKAIQSFSEALTYTTSDSFEFYLITGEIEYLQGNPEKALTNYNLAYSKKPSDFQINNALNLFYLDLEDLYPEHYIPSKALTHAKTAYQNSETEVKSISAQNLALAYYFNEDYLNAIKYLNLSDQKDPYTAYWLGLSHINNDDLDTGRTYLIKAQNAGVQIPAELSDYLY